MFLIQFSSAQTFYLGGNLGFSDASGPRTPKEAEPSIGGRAGWLFYDHVGFGVLAQFHQINSRTESIGYFPLLAEVSFFPYKSPLEKTALFVSALFGTTKIIYDEGASEGTNTQTTFGAAAGYLIYIEPRYSIGPEFQYLFIFDNEKYAVWSALVTTRVWF